MGIRSHPFLFVMSRSLGYSADLSALSRSLDPDWIARAVCSTGKASIRRRKLPAEQVVWLVIALALYRHQSIPEVVAHLDLVLPDEINPEIAKSALTQARQRLGQAPLAQLFAISSACWDERHQGGPDEFVHRSPPGISTIAFRARVKSRSRTFRR